MFAKIKHLHTLQGAKGMPSLHTSTDIETNNKPEKSTTSSLNKDVEGWYVMKVLWRQEEKTELRFSEYGIETYLPKRQVLREDRHHKKQRVSVPAINSLIFVRSSIRVLERVKEEIRVKYGQTIYFYTNREGGRNVITSIPEQQMNQFRSACEIAGDEIQYFLPEELTLAKGTKVRIHGGPFEGHEGVLLKIKGKRSRSLIVSIEGFLSAAVAEVSPDFVEVIK